MLAKDSNTDLYIKEFPIIIGPLTYKLSRVARWSIRSVLRAKTILKAQSEVKEVNRHAWRTREALRIHLSERLSILDLLNICVYPYWTFPAILACSVNHCSAA